MTSRAFRCQVRLGLNDIDRQVYGQRTVVLAQQPDEPDEHILLRFLAFVFFFHERMEDAHGWIDLARPDLEVRDLIDELEVWVECGTPPIKRVTRALGRHKGARFIALFADPEEAVEFRADLRSHRARNIDRMEVYLVDAHLMERLEDIAGRSMQWSATLNEGLLYLDCDGELLEGKITRQP